jgi:hypothetical protein
MRSKGIRCLEFASDFSWAACHVVAFWLPLAIAFTACRREGPPQAPEQGPSPASIAPGLQSEPLDLHDCTRVEIRYLPSTPYYFLGGDFAGSREVRILNSEEMEYLKAVQWIVLDDPARLRALAQEVAQAVYHGPVKGSPRIRNAMEVVYYNADKRAGCFLARWDDILVRRGEDYEEYLLDGKGLPSIMQEPLPLVGPFALRISCAKRVWRLWHGFYLYFRNEHKYPAPGEWCDAVTRSFLANRYAPTQIQKRFMCPGAGEAKCHYAMNPHCTADSPPDTVLLFESTGGWNQHGGPELFAFDHHDPRGGCVILNDGDPNGLRSPSVLFVRTPEELKQLRWK